MSLKTITDRNGHQFQWAENNGFGMFEVLRQTMIPEGMVARMKEIKSFELRDDDIMVCAFPKSGTHWIWEIASMVISGTAEYETRTKETLMFEFTPAEDLDSCPSPRILNSHLRVSCLPDQVVSKKTKILHVTRNPKDIAVSYFHHLKAFNSMFDVAPFETFSDFLPYITGEYGVHFFVSMWKYLPEFEKFDKEHQGQMLNLRFEDMITDPMEAVRKIAKFLDKDLSEVVMKNIAEKCSFKSLKAANDSLKKHQDRLAERVKQTFETLEKDKKKPSEPTYLFRKGEVGDWKNYFTVAESEQFDKFMEETLAECDIKFVFSL